MSTSGITSSLLTGIAGSPSSANQFVTDLNQLAKDLKSNNLSAAQQDFVTLSQDALNGATSSTATTSDSGITTSLLSSIAGSSTSTNSFVSELNQLGSDLQNGSLGTAQNDLLSLDSTALNAAPSAGASSASAIAPSHQAQTSELIHSIIDALDAGDDSSVSAAMSQLASISSSSEGASYLSSDSASFGSSAGSSSSSSSSSGSIGQLLDSLNSNSSSSPLSSLNLLA